MLKFNKLKTKRLNKKDKEEAVLLGAVNLFIKEAKPVGSNTLKENGFDFLSSATIRNYFSNLEKMGYLKQHHSSGGRIPTSKGFRAYANDCLKNIKTNPSEEIKFEQDLPKECKQVTSYLHNAAEKLSSLTNGCVFLLSPLFEQDFIQEIKLLPLHCQEILCILITDFGQIKTEIINIETPLSEKELKLLEQFLLWRINKAPKPTITEQLTKNAQKIYNEIMLRHVASFSSQNQTETTYKTGLSKLLLYPEFQDPQILANSLALFEDFDKIKTLLYESIKLNQLTCWIGDELAAFGSLAQECCIVTVPYRINKLPVGALAVLLPQRADYEEIFTLTNIFSNVISKNLTNSIYKFKISFQPSFNMFNQNKSHIAIMLEDKSKLQEKK